MAYREITQTMPDTPGYFRMSNQDKTLITFVKCAKHKCELRVIKEEYISPNVVAQSIEPCQTCLLEERLRALKLYKGADND